METIKELLLYHCLIKSKLVALCNSGCHYRCNDRLHFGLFRLAKGKKQPSTNWFLCWSILGSKILQSFQSLFFQHLSFGSKIPQIFSPTLSTKFMGIHWRPQIFIDPGPPRSRLGARVPWMVIPLVKGDDFTSAKKTSVFHNVWRIQFFHQYFPLFLFSGLFPAIWVYHYHVWCIYNGGIGKCTSLHQRSPSSLGSMALTRERFTPCGHNS